MTQWTLVSHPGPAEASILSELAPEFAVRRHLAADVMVRTLESEGPATPSLPPVLLLHGRGHAAPVWWPMLPDLARRTRVVAVDLPGFGHSAARPWTRGQDGLGFFLDPLRALVLALELRSAVVVGHSLGALLALALVLEDTLDPHGLVLIGAMGLSPQITTYARGYLHAGPERLARFQAPIRRLVGAQPADRTAAMRLEWLGVRHGRPDAVRAFCDLCPPLGQVRNVQRELGRIHHPTLLVWGADDEAFPLEIAVEAVAHMPRAELHVLPGGHSPHIEHAAEVRERLLAFLDAIEPNVS